MRANAPGSFDDVWCVVDVDEFDLEPTVRLAARENISLAVSDPCFETWLLLHSKKHTAPLTCFAEVERTLLKYVPDYCEAKSDFAQYADGVGPQVRAQLGLGWDVAEAGQELAEQVGELGSALR